MKKNRKKLNDVFDWELGSGIFNALQAYDVPWSEEDIAISLDYEYFGNVSGDKFLSPLLEKLIAGDTITPEEKTILCGVILSMFSVNWTKQWITLSAEYNPIENYRMTETMENDETVDDFGHTNTRTYDDLTHSKTGTETTTPDLSQSRTETYHGFNSTDGVPVTDDSQTTTGENEIAYNTAETDTGSVEDVESGQNTRTRNYELTRSGNIGVTTSQQMLESERALWMWNYFRDVVFPDLDRVLALEIY